MNAPPQMLICGAGVVGCATAAVLAEGGYSVAAVDPDPAAVGRFPGPVLDREACARPWHAIFVCVPTPTIDGRMDDGPLVDALRFIAALPFEPGAVTHIVIRSTLVPGTMDRLVRPLLEAHIASGRMTVAHWPSFARERSAVADERSPRSIVIGTYEGGAESGSFLRAALAHIPVTIRFVRPVEAELIKHGANLYNSLKISYFNAIADWSAERDADGQVVASLIATVAEGAWNPGYGTRAGPAFGGACLAKDLAALAGQFASDGTSHVALLDAISGINTDPRRQLAATAIERPEFA